MSHTHEHPPVKPDRELRPAPVAPPPTAPPPQVEDAGAQALADALSSSFRIVKLLMVILVIAFLASGIFTVNPNEVAVLLRFGKPAVGDTGELLRPGLHWAFPYPIDEIVRIPLGQSRTVVSTTSWYATTPELEAAGQPPPAMPYLRPGVDGYTLTSDNAIIHVRATLKYRLQERGVLGFTFNYADPDAILKDILDNALYYASANFTADEAIFAEKERFTALVRDRINQGLQELGLGVTIETLDVQTSAPIEVRTAFDEVLNAQQTYGTRISEAEAYARGATNTAFGQASVIEADGLTRSNQLVQIAAAEARSFSDQLPHFQTNPQLFKQRLLTETMRQVLTNAQDKFFVPARQDGQPRELRIQLNREPPRITNLSGANP